MPDMPQRPDGRPPRRPTATPPAGRVERRSAIRLVSADDKFFRHIVSSMRNGVIAFRRDGALALMNDEAYRVFGLTPSAGDIGRPFAEDCGMAPGAVHSTHRPGLGPSPGVGARPASDSRPAMMLSRM